MHKTLWLLKWILKAAIFLILFAFALNNRHEAVMNLFLGYVWQAPMALILLVVFALGLLTGVLGVAPSWWRHRRMLTQQKKKLQPTPVTPSTSIVSAVPAVIQEQNLTNTSPHIAVITDAVSNDRT